MNTRYNKPKQFGEILDETFRYCKSNFSQLFLIFLIVTGPVYLLETLLQMFSGASFFRELGSGDTWGERLYGGMTATEVEEFNLGQDLISLIVGVGLFVMGAFAQAAILFSIQAKKSNHDFTVGTVIKKAFSKFWPILVSTILFGLILFGLIFVSFFVIGIVIVIGALIIPFIGILLAIPLFLGTLGLIIFLATRFSLYLCAVIFEDEVPGLGRSWRLTRGNLWRLIGLYAVLYLILLIVSNFIELALFGFLGDSVLQTIIMSLINIFTLMVFSVGYGIIYFDIRVRKEAHDLSDMLEEYVETP